MMRHPCPGRVFSIHCDQKLAHSTLERFVECLNFYDDRLGRNLHIGVRWGPASPLVNERPRVTFSPEL